MTMREAWNTSWNVNTAGTQIMTAAFVPLLLRSKDPRLLYMTSGTSTLTGTENLNLPVNKVPAKGWPKEGLSAQSIIPAYRASKCGMNMMMRGMHKNSSTTSLASNTTTYLMLGCTEWYRTLKEDGVKVFCLSPGFLATGLGGNLEASKNLGAGDPATAGLFVRNVLEGQRDKDVGKVILREGVQPW